MGNFDDIFEAAPQTDEFDKEAWAAKKKAERDEVYALADTTAEAVCADGGTASSVSARAAMVTPRRWLVFRRP